MTGWLRCIALMPLLWAGMAAHAQPSPATAYPAKPIHLLVPASPGGPTDVIGRLLAERLAGTLGQPVLVDNKVGASQSMGSLAVARAEPDGYTLLMGSSSALVLLPFTTKNLPYDTKRDFAMVAHVATTPLVLYANAATPVTSLKAMVAMAKASPGTLSYSSFGNGSSAHLLGEYLGKQAGIKMIHVPYKGVAPQINDLLSGQTTFAIATIGSASQFVKTGRLRALAVSGSGRSALYPDVPTFAEQGVAGMEPFSPWWSVLAPAGTPQPIVDKLSTQIVQIVRSPAFTAQLNALGADVTALPAAPASEAMLGELALWQKIVAELPDIKLE